ncbi:MAG: NADAR family protein [Pseudomonadota bacterium]
MEHRFFWNGPFSQWYPCQFEIDGVAFTSAEQAMMHSKAQLFGDAQAAERIMAATDPGHQKALGRTVRGFSERVWRAKRYDIVLRNNTAKFSQNRGLRRKLFQTGEDILVEASPVDTVWGIGLDADAAARTDPADWPGENLLGKALTEVRALLSIDFADEAARGLRLR